MEILMKRTHSLTRDEIRHRRLVAVTHLSSSQLGCWGHRAQAAQAPAVHWVVGGQEARGCRRGPARSLVCSGQQVPTQLQHTCQALVPFQILRDISGFRTAQLTLCSRSPGYQVSWEVYGRNGSRLTHTLSNTTHEYKIKGLSSLTTYTIDVAAVTAAGTGLATSSTISSGVPPGQ